jgi:hypothetical protein
VAFTHITPGGFEVSSNIQLNINGRNKDTDYRSGTEYQHEFALGQHAGAWTSASAGTATSADALANSRSSSARSTPRWPCNAAVVHTRGAAATLPVRPSGMSDQPRQAGPLRRPRRRGAVVMLTWSPTESTCV